MIKQKIGKCSECDSSAPEQPLIAGKCQRHYWQFRSKQWKKSEPKEKKPIPRRSKKKIAMFLKTVWLESESRYEMFQDKEFPLKTVYQFSKRVTLYKGGVKMKNSGMIAYAWYVCDKDYVGKPTIEWIL